MSDRSRDAAYFEAMYAADPDPWRFRTSAYEAAKYAATVAAIADRRYRSGLEVGCSIGVLSQQVAPLCDVFLGLDIAEAPLIEARSRCKDLSQVRFARMAVPEAWPEGGFDLILLSEVLYFLNLEDIATAASHVRRSLLAGGTVLLVNWIGNPQPPDLPAAPQLGDWAAEAFLAAADLPVVRQDRAELYRLDLLRRPSQP
jgi:cyclopropane fatty-acyl-phospholipid synthase-like methyltransferase